MVKFKKGLSCLMIVMLVITGAMITNLTKVDAAATKGTADAMVEQAKLYKNKTLAQVKKSMKQQGYAVYLSSYKAAWCAWYISACAKNAGLAKIIPGDTWAYNLPGKVIKAGGEGIFFSKADANYVFRKISAAKKGRYRITSRSKFVPQKGDLIFFDWASGHTIDHVGIVERTSGKYVYTIEGNKEKYGGKSGGDRYSITDTRIVSYVRPNYNKGRQYYTIKYNPNGGTGSMYPSTIIYGQPQQLHKNTFTREGFIFDGWYIYRSGINKWAYTNGKESHYYEKGRQPSGYWLETYKEDAKVMGTSSINGEVVILYAKWKPADPHYFNYDLKDESATADFGESMYVWDESIFSITYEIPVRTGYDFMGWNAYRLQDQKYYVTGKGWLSNSEIISKGYTKRLYHPGEKYRFNYSWKAGCSQRSNYRFEAVWKAKGDVAIDKPDDPTEVIGFVSESDYYAKYADDMVYDATPYYRYATREKEYTESTSNNLSGWTLYNTISKPVSSNWSQTRPASGSYETGYLYSCYGWEHNGDWTFYYDNDYNNAVAWIRKNYTIWNYNQFRYFWQVYPAHKGSYVKVSQTVNYRDNAGRTGTKAIKGTKLWYEGRVYRQTGSTTYQYWRWGSWSSYGSWTTNKQSVSENVKEEVRFYIVRK